MHIYLGVSLTEYSSTYFCVNIHRIALQSCTMHRIALHYRGLITADLRNCCFMYPSGGENSYVADGAKENIQRL